MTKEEVEQAFNGLSPYYAYKQGVQDGIAYNDESFRRDAAKDILAGIIASSFTEDRWTYQQMAEMAIEQADELIKQLKAK